jgi:F-type H+-transporting ATPase subunit b
MAAAAETTTGTQVPEGRAGLPQMDVETFPSQVFWLVVTFGLLFIVLWRNTLPMIAGAIGARRGQIDGDLGAAEARRKDAAGALQSYEAALASAKSRAHALADENKKRVVGEIEAIKNTADSESQTAMAAAEKRIAAQRTDAVAGVKTAAAAAAADIVERLIGTPVSPNEAANAVAAATAKGS